MTELKNRIVESEFKNWFYCESYIEDVEDFFGSSEKILFSQQYDKNGKKVNVFIDNFSIKQLYICEYHEFDKEFSHEKTEEFLEKSFENQLTKELYELNGEDYMPTIYDFKKYFSAQTYEEILSAYNFFFDLVTNEEKKEFSKLKFDISQDRGWTSITANGETYYFTNIKEDDFPATIVWDEKINKPLVLEHYFDSLADNPLPLWIFGRNSYGEEFEFDKNEELYKKFLK